MNLLLEQRPTSVKSSKSQAISSALLAEPSNDYDLNSSSSSSSSSSSLVLKLKRQTTTTATTSQASRMTGEDDEEHDDQQATRSTRMKQRSHPSSSSSSTASSTTMATTRRPSSPAFNGKQQANSKRSIAIDNNNNDLSSHLDEISSSKRFKSDPNHTSSANKVDASVETVSVGLATEPDHLGPCEPGTSVVLEGIVWNETDSGVLVVNVTWRGKTYVGTLLDSTKQDWACPRLTCESPTSDYDPRSSSKTSRTKRTTAGGTSRATNSSNTSVSSFQQITSIILSSGIDDRRLRNNVKSRQSKRLNQLSMPNNEESTASPSPLASPHRTNQTFFPSETATTTTGNSEGQLIPCSEANCHKRFTSTVALGYHLSDAHKKTSSSSSSSSSSSTTPIVSQANRRDEEDVAHILANVAHYARRASPPPVTSPDRQVLPQPPPAAAAATSNSTPLTWPCPQISSNLVQTSSLNNDERQKLPTEKIYSASNILDNPSQSTSTSNESDAKTNERKSPSISSNDSPSWNGEKKDRNNNKKRSKTTPVPTASSSTFVPITLPSSIPLTSSSPAYSDISDEEPTDSVLPPSTINLLSGTHSNAEEKSSPTSTFLPANSDWTAQMLFQQFSPYISQSTLVPTPTTSIVPSTTKETTKSKRSTTPNGLNSKNHSSSSPDNDSTVKNILDARRSSTIKGGSPSTSPPMNLFHFHSNGTTANPTDTTTTKFSPSIINTLTSPNENLLHPATNPTPTTSSTTTVTPTPTPPSTLKPMEILDFSLNPSNGQYAHSSSLHPSR